MSGSSSEAGGSVRASAGTLMSRTRSSNPAGVQMNSMRHPFGPTAYRCGMSRGPQAKSPAAGLDHLVADV